MRQLDPRLRGPAPSTDFDLRDPRAQDRFNTDPRRDRDRDLRDRDMRDRDMGMMRDRDRDLRESRENRDRDLRDPRSMFSGSAGGGGGGGASAQAVADPRARRGGGGEGSSSGQSRAAPAPVVAPIVPAGMTGFAAGATDAEKAALIMEVLKLSNEQIAVLPAEQRQSILALKEQIARSTSQGR